MDKSIHALSAEDRLILIYTQLLKTPTFENYEMNAVEIDNLFVQLQQDESYGHDLGKLNEIKKLHDQVVSMILLEKESLSEQISSFKRKKFVSGQYGKVSNYEGMDAFFVDYKK